MLQEIGSFRKAFDGEKSNRLLSVFLTFCFLVGSCAGYENEEVDGFFQEPPKSDKRPSQGKRVLVLFVQGMSEEHMNEFLRPALLAGRSAGRVTLKQKRRQTPEQEDVEMQDGIEISSILPPEPGSSLTTLLTMMTGRSPAEHGVLAGRFMRRGKSVRGEHEPILAKTVIREARERNMNIMTWDIPGVLCDSTYKNNPRFDSGLGEHFAVCGPSFHNVGPSMPDLLPWPAAGPRQSSWAELARQVDLKSPRVCKTGAGKGFGISGSSGRKNPILRLWSTSVKAQEVKLEASASSSDLGRIRIVQDRGIFGDTGSEGNGGSDGNGGGDGNGGNEENGGSDGDWARIWLESHGKDQQSDVQGDVQNGEQNGKQNGKQNEEQSEAEDFLEIGQWKEKHISGVCDVKEEKDRNYCSGLDFFLKLLESDSATGRTLLYGTSMTRLHVSDKSKCPDLRRASIAWPPKPDFGSYSKGWADPVTMAEVSLLRDLMAGRFVSWLIEDSSWNFALVRMDTPRRLSQFLDVSPFRRDMKKSEIKRLRALWHGSMTTFSMSLADLISKVNERDTVIVLVGTGGLVPTHMEVRLGSIVQEAAPGSRVVGNEGSAFVYLNEMSRRSGARDLLRYEFENLEWNGRRVFREHGGVKKSVQLPPDLKRPESGDLLLEATCGLRLSGRRGKKRFRTPGKMAAECFDNEDPRTHGGLIVLGRELETSLPSFMKAECVAYWLRRFLGIQRDGDDESCL